MERFNSLTTRVLLFATIWAAIALVVIALVISALFRQSAEKGLRDLLRAQLFGAINSVSVDETTKELTGSPQMSELGFMQPESGWYWSVEPLGDYKTEPLRSDSFEGVTVPTLPNAVAPYNSRFERYYPTQDSLGNDVMVAEAEILLDDEDHSVRFRMIGNHNIVDEEVGSFQRRLYLALGIFGVGSLLVNALAILLGLRPLDHVRGALMRIRNGEAEHLDDGFPREIQPMASEVNALIDSNRRIVERARMQVGNLAHSLKTPIAVLINEARNLDAPHGQLVISQVEAMQAQVQSYLNRARIAAQRESILARTDVEPVIERLIRVMRKLNPDKTFQFNVFPKGLVLAMEAQDFEETMGNLLENASRFATSLVSVTLAAAPEGVTGSDPQRKNWIFATVDDDGPGLQPEEIKEAMKRGRRLDESKPGTGLGLSIVNEIASEYQGSFALTRSPMGGLRAELVLPAINREL